MRLALFRYFAVLYWTGLALGAEVTGHIQRLEDKEHDNSIVVVYAEALDGQSPLKPGHYDMKQKDKTFVPHVLTVPAGSSVSFPNDDLIFHNVFSLSLPAPFDLGLYRAGEAKTRTIEQPSIYRVFCNIHPQMSAIILVLPTSWITEANAKGVYRINLPQGRYRLTAWSERSTPASAEITVESAAVSVPDLTLDESRFVAMAHKNKYGQQYPLSAYVADRR
jgi:plastocyanin